MKDIENETKLMTIKCIVYLVTNLINGKVYVGKTINTFYDRYNSSGHGAERIKRSYEINGGKGNCHLYNSMCKYGTENFKVEIIHIGKSNEEICYFEHFYEVVYNARNEMYGYNIQKCGDSRSGYHMPDEYWLNVIDNEHGLTTKENVKKFLEKRKKKNIYNGNECYLLCRQKIKYLGVNYNGLLNIPKKVVKTTSIKKIYNLDYIIIKNNEKDNQENNIKKIIKLQKKQARILLNELYEPYLDENGFIRNKEEWVKNKIEYKAIKILEENFPELYQYLLKYSNNDINFLLKLVFW